MESVYPFIAEEKQNHIFIWVTFSNSFPKEYCDYILKIIIPIERKHSFHNQNIFGFVDFARYQRRPPQVWMIELHQVPGHNACAFRR